MLHNLRIRCAAGALLAATAAGSSAQTTTTYEDGADGIRYQVTRQVVQRQIPVTQNQPQQQTYYRQQVTTENVTHQQMYAVPVTQYQLVSTLHGRWNPFVTPHWTHEYQPVTTWQQQTATVQIPVNRVALVPETRTVDVPVTTYRTADQVVESRVPVGASASFAGAKPLVASSTPYSNQTDPLSSATGPAGQPSATLAARPSAPLNTAAAPASSTYGAAPTYGGSPYNAGGVAMPSDPPKQATGWQQPSAGDRYGQRR